MAKISALPFSIRILLESALRNCDGYAVREDDVKNLAGWNAAKPAQVEIPFHPTARAAAGFHGRAGRGRSGGHARRDEATGRRSEEDQSADSRRPGDRSLGAGRCVQQPDGARQPTSTCEYERNRERYEFLRWGQKAFANFRAVPPSVGIVHQVNLEYLAKGVFLRGDNQRPRGRARYAGRHRQPHHDDQRPGRARLGRRRHRGRSRDARSAALHADARGGRLQTDRPIAAGHHRHGPGADGDANSAQSRASSASSSSSSDPAFPR